LQGRPAGPPDFPKGCRGFNRWTPSDAELLRNQASFVANPGHLAASAEWQARVYVAEENRAAYWRAFELTGPALQRLAF
jgi:hypothetical protein